MITPEQLTLIVLQSELKECGNIIRELNNKKHAEKELIYWEKYKKTLEDRLFELQVLLGVEL